MIMREQQNKTTEEITESLADGYIKELGVYFERDIKEDLVNNSFKLLVEIYYSYKKDTIRDYNLKIFNGLNKTKQLKQLIKLCLKENKSLKYFWGGY